MKKRILRSKRDAASLISIVMLLAVFFTALIGGVSAKYTQSGSNENAVVAKEFYFTSNLLTESGKSYTLNPGTDKITFTLGNNIDALRFSEVNINYTVTVTCGEKPVSTKNGTLKTGNSPKIENIELDNLENGKTYKVTAVGQNGYKVTLKADFTVADDGSEVYKHLDTTNPAFVLLTVWTENVSGVAKIDINKAGLIPDNTDTVMASVKNYANSNYATFEFTDRESFDVKYASRTYRFFIDDVTGITVNDFDVTVDDHVAEANTP